MSKFPPRPVRVYEELAARIVARQNCIASNNDYRATHEETIDQLVKDFLPSGSGVDSGTQVNLDRSNGDRLVLEAGYHHMNDSGMYDGWTEHTITVTPSFIGRFDLRIDGRNRNGIKDYLAELFHTALDDRIIWDAEADCYVRYAVPEI